MRKLAIIHFGPIELYPPVLNWINFLSTREAEIQVRVFTIKYTGHSETFVAPSGNIKIYRPGTLSKLPGFWKKNALFVYLNYASFYFIAILKLITWRPGVIMYYETLSSLPALIYKKYFKRSARLFIHYHEYTSDLEYKNNMLLSRWEHTWEQKMFPLAEWISQTNADRINLFRKDNEGIKLPPLYELPNYPPASWQKSRKARDLFQKPLRIVYVGALSLDTMYTREFADWVIGQSGAVIWDIYSDNLTADAKIFLDTIGSGHIRFKAAVNYFSLPDTLAGYDVGVILYKGHILNYVYNAPNKIFEYLSCGLDVWFPHVMTGSHYLVTEKTYPKVTVLDFGNFDRFDVASALDRTGLTFKPPFYSCEEVLLPLLMKIE